MGVCLIGPIFAVGCQTFESAAITDITLRNDTSRAVVVRACETSACEGFRYTGRLAAQESVPATDRGDGRSWWLVLTDRGKRLGCLSLDYTHRQEGYVIRMSRIASCPT
jgi:hypothetical protein